MVRMRIEGGDELAKVLAGLSTRLSKKILREALLDGGEPMRVLMGQHAPRAAGEPDLAEHLAIAAVRDQENQASVGIGPDEKFFFYDLFQEFGTARHKAQPFYRPAFDEKAPEAVSLIGDELWRQLTARGFGVRTASVPTPVQSGGRFL
jgi:HK97 gp10 family phage protein